MSNANLEKNLAIFYTFYATILLCYSFLGSVFFVISFLVHRWLICQNKETVQQTFEKVCIFCDKHKQHLFPLQLIRLECPKGVKTKSIGSSGPLSIFLKEILRQYFWQIGNIAGVASPQLRLIQPPSSSTTDSIFERKKLFLGECLDTKYEGALRRKLVTPEIVYNNKNDLLHFFIIVYI